MTYLNNLLSSADFAASDSFLLRIGRREITICRDFRKRFYPTNRVIECRAGQNPGHVEILLLRHWLVIFSKARR